MAVSGALGVQGALLLNGAFVLSIAAPVSVQGAIGAVTVFDGLGSGDNPTDPKFQRRRTTRAFVGSERPSSTRAGSRSPGAGGCRHRSSTCSLPKTPPRSTGWVRSRRPCRCHRADAGTHPQGGCYGCSFSRACGSAYLRGPDAVPAPPPPAATEKKPLRSRQDGPTSGRRRRLTKQIAALEKQLQASTDELAAARREIADLRRREINRQRAEELARRIAEEE